MSAKCDYCDQSATSLAGDTNGVLVCEDHVRLFAEREIAAAIDDCLCAHVPSIPGAPDVSCPRCPTPVPSEADPGTGEREAACPWCHYGDPHPTLADCPDTPDGGDVGALGKVLGDAFRAKRYGGGPEVEAGLAAAVLASDWLASRDAATADRVRRKTSEGIAAAIEAEVFGDVGTRHRAARIAREAGQDR